jgi:hypothetical protein
MAQRLDVVRQRIGIALDGAPPGPLTAISMVAGEGRDLLPVLATHPRRRDVVGLLVELDPDLAATARDTASAAGLVGIEVRDGDAAELDRYRRYVPADLVLICGLFGNISDEDIRRTIGYAPSLTKRGGTVIWTRYRSSDDLFSTVATWFGEAGFDEVFTSDASHGYGVGVHCSRVDPPPLPPGVSAFTFVGY